MCDKETTSISRHNKSNIHQTNLRLKEKVEKEKDEFEQHVKKIVKDILKKYDLIFSALPQFVNYFRKNHLKSEYLPLAFNNAVLKKINLPVVRTIPISFVGSISSHRNETINLLKFLCKNVADFRIYGIASKRDLLNNGLLDNYYGEAFGLKMYEVLSNSLITVNRHINLAGDFAANLRIYEATGMGSYQIGRAHV